MKLRGSGAFVEIKIQGLRNGSDKSD